MHIRVIMVELAIPIQALAIIAQGVRRDMAGKIVQRVLNIRNA